MKIIATKLREDASSAYSCGLVRVQLYDIYPISYNETASFLAPPAALSARARHLYREEKSELRVCDMITFVGKLKIWCLYKALARYGN